MLVLNSIFQFRLRSNKFHANSSTKLLVLGKFLWLAVHIIGLLETGKLNAEHIALSDDATAFHMLFPSKHRRRHGPSTAATLQPSFVET
jgi:hypothetical protein